MTEQIEVYPKQAAVAGGPGSLVRLPLGVHRKNQERYLFDNALDPAFDSQVRALMAIGRLASAFVVGTLSVADVPTVTASRRTVARPTPATIGGKTTIEVIKAVLDLRAFISDYVQLTPSGRGHCPFHDDAHMSFSVNKEKGYWHCFSGLRRG